MLCPLLESLKGLPARSLLTLASSIISYDDISKAKDENSGVLNYLRLAELAYYAMGEKLLSQGEFNQMTRLHMEHALQARGWLEEEEKIGMTEWSLRLRLYCKIKTAEIKVKKRADSIQAIDSASENESEASYPSDSSDGTVW